MNRAFAVVILSALWTATSPGQSSTGQPAFEATDVHASTPGMTDGFVSLRAGRAEVRGATLLQLIMAAHGMRYGREDDRVSGGPKWLDTDRFDIVAKSAPGSSPESLQSMLQALLADRFQLATHNEEKPLPVYVLTVGKSLKMKESTPGAQTDCKGDRVEGVIVYACHNMTMAGLAEGVRQMAGAYFDRPLIDRTGLKGEYDFTLKWTPKGQLGLPGPNGEASTGISLFDALDKQLGLKAEKVTEPGSVIVVDHVNQKPTDNPPDTMEKLPPVPTEFEVAEIRPSKPGADGDFTMKNGRLQAIGMTMRDLITAAYGVEDEMVVGGEKWLDTDHFDIVAKTTPTASFDALSVMLRTLLQQRFKLAIHKEDRPMPVYALTMPRKTTKLKEAASDVRGGCKIGVENGLRTYTCQNTTMAVFAEKLRQVASGYLDHPVVDLTGLTGSYDFAVSWTGAGRVRALGAKTADGGQSSGGAPAAADPSTSLTIFEAIDKQLGLKLAAQKQPMPTVVIDHVERTPTEN